MKSISSFGVRVASFTGVMLGAFALAALAQTWSAPTAPPPSGNVPAPINVGSLAQIKTGNLTVDGLGIVTPSFIFKPTASAVTPGQVLTALDTLGTVGWQTPAAGSSASLDALCSSTWIPPEAPALNGTVAGIDMRIGGRNICSDYNGCSYRIWSTDSSNPNGVNFYGSNPVMYRQVGSGQIGANHWRDSAGNEFGTNGDTSHTNIVDPWSGLTVKDDYGSNDASGGIIGNFWAHPGSTALVGNISSNVDVSGLWWSAGVNNSVISGTNYLEESADWVTAINTDKNTAFIFTLCDF